MGYSVEARSREGADAQTEQDKKRADYNPAPQYNEQRRFDHPGTRVGIDQHHEETGSETSMNMLPKRIGIGSPEFDLAIDHFGHFMRIFLTHSS